MRYKIGTAATWTLPPFCVDARCAIETKSKVSAAAGVSRVETCRRLIAGHRVTQTYNLRVESRDDRHASQIEIGCDVRLAALSESRQPESRFRQCVLMMRIHSRRATPTARRLLLYSRFAQVETYAED